MDLRWMTPAGTDAVIAAGELFDNEPRPVWTERFLAQPGHHLCLAYVEGEPVGFVSGVELTHPDKGTEMILYELAVDEGHRRRGIGTALVAALADRARERDCYGMFVLVDADNVAALRMYRSANAGGDATSIMLEWRLEPS